MPDLLPKTVEDLPVDVFVSYKNYPTNTYYVDDSSEQINGMCDGIVAMTQAIRIICEVERFQYSIFSPNVGLETIGLVGNDYGYVISDFKRRILDAFSTDDRIIGLTKYDYSELIDGKVEIRIDVRTVYGDIQRDIILELT